jgi:hypothetical protein
LYASLPESVTYTHTEHYWQACFDGNQAVAAVAGEAGFPPVERTVQLRGGAVPA